MNVPGSLSVSASKGGSPILDAYSFQNAANVLQGAATAIFTETDDQRVWEMTGAFVGMMVLRALATELVLKALSHDTKGTYRTDRDGHDLLILFEDLDDNTKRSISKTAATEGVSSIESILEQHRHDFVKWRYPDEANKEADMLDLDKALNVLIDTYRQMWAPNKMRIQIKRS